MNYFKLPIMEQSDASLTLYLHEILPGIEIEKRPILLIIPGGGYGHLSEREAEPIAMAYYHMGYHAAILRYSIGENARNLQPMKEGITAIKIIRENADQWNVIKDQVIAVGFSAGGHLACSLGVMWNEVKLMEEMGYEGNCYQPNAMILSYPVISSGQFAHRGSFMNLTGSMENDTANDFFSLEKRVDKNTPPTFIWHTKTDASVPVENTLLFVDALQKNEVPYELHIFNKGKHGLSLCNKETNSENPHCSHWFELSLEWLEETLND
jgi:acetyl esterase/lipase